MIIFIIVMNMCCSKHMMFLYKQYQQWGDLPNLKSQRSVSNILFLLLSWTCAAPNIQCCFCTNSINSEEIVTNLKLQHSVPKILFLLLSWTCAAPNIWCCFCTNSINSEEIATFSTQNIIFAVIMNMRCSKHMMLFLYKQHQHHSGPPS